MNLKKTILALSVALTAASQAVAVKTTSKPGFDIEADKKLLVLPSGFYYLGEEADYEKPLHFYSPSTGIDVMTDVSVPSHTGANFEGMWTDPTTGKVFIAWEDGGMELREIVIMQIENNGKGTLIKEIEGYLPSMSNGYDGSGQCDIKIKDGYIIITDHSKPSIYTLGMEKGTLPVPSKINIEAPALGFVRITGDGVNFRRYPDANSPRLFKEVQEYYDGIETWEDEKEKGVAYILCHPSKGDVLPYYIPEINNDKWQPVIMTNGYSIPGIQGYVSSRFATPVGIDGISMGDDSILNKPGAISSTTRYIDKGKYEGLWINIQFQEMYDDGGIYFGKKVGDAVVFYASSPFPFYDEKISGVTKTAYGICYGNDRSCNAYADIVYGINLDIFKLDEKDIDTIYSAAIPTQSNRYLVKTEGVTRLLNLPATQAY